MEKTSEKITKGPKHAEAGRKGRKSYMNKLKEDILNDAKKGSEDTSNASNETTNVTTNASNETTSVTNTTTTPANNTTTKRSNYTYVYGVGMLAVLAIGVCVFFAYNTFPKNLSMKNRINHQNDVICFRKIHNK